MLPDFVFPVNKDYEKQAILTRLYALIQQPVFFFFVVCCLCLVIVLCVVCCLFGKLKLIILLNAK